MWPYSIVNRLYVTGIRAASLFSDKAKKAIHGRKDFFKNNPEDKNSSYIWFHCSSLGEFEQGRPLIEKTKEQFPQKKILLTFFSPSGYEMRKNYAGADKILYLPFDSKRNAKKFLQTFKIEKAIFVKYDLWPFYVQELIHAKIPVYLVSALFRNDQFYFKWYGAFYRKLLKKLDKIFVQNKESLEIAAANGFANVEVAGDMRIDRVIQVKNNASRVETVERFLKGAKAIVCGSVYPAEIEIVKYISDRIPSDQKLIIAPHNTSPDIVSFFRKQIPGSVTYEQGENDPASRVMIIDHIGSLNRIYQYAGAVYIGGGFGRSIHNILEPAVYGVPVFFGPAFSKFPEAEEFIKSGIGFSDKDPLVLADKIVQASGDIRSIDIRHICENWFSNNSGATKAVFNTIFL